MLASNKQGGGGDRSGSAIDAQSGYIVGKPFRKIIANSGRSCRRCSGVGVAVVVGVGVVGSMCMSGLR